MAVLAKPNIDASSPVPWEDLGQFKEPNRPFVISFNLPDTSGPLQCILPRSDARLVILGTDDEPGPVIQALGADEIALRKDVSLLLTPRKAYVNQILGVESRATWFQSLLEYDRPFHPRTDLDDALDDLERVGEEAQEEGFPLPSEKAISNARPMLEAMYRFEPYRYEVYPTPDGEIAIDVPNGRGSSVLVLCDSSGGALCMVNMDGDHRRKTYPACPSSPDRFIQQALRELELRAS